jgi:hypothetical protein
MVETSSFLTNELSKQQIEDLVLASLSTLSNDHDDSGSSFCEIYKEFTDVLHQQTGQYMETYQFLFVLIDLFRKDLIFSTTDMNYFSTKKLTEKYLTCTEYVKDFAKASGLDDRFRLYFEGEKTYSYSELSNMLLGPA